MAHGAGDQLHVRALPAEATGSQLRGAHMEQLFGMEDQPELTVLLDASTMPSAPVNLFGFLVKCGVWQLRNMELFVRQLMSDIHKV